MTYFWLITISSVIAAVGILELTIVIPACGRWFKESDAKTEFYSVRAAYLCTMIGVSVLGMILIGGLVEHILIGIASVAIHTAH